MNNIHVLCAELAPYFHKSRVYLTFLWQIKNENGLNQEKIYA